MNKMYSRVVFVLVALSIVLDATDGRRQKKTDQQPKDEENPAPQPSVLTYSTFGFNDVGSYDGFVPTSPDLTSHLNKYKETSEKLYAPAFPSAPDNDFSSSSQPLNGEPFATGDAGQQTSMLPYNNANVYNSANFKSDGDDKNSVSEFDYGHRPEENNSPVYGSKISSNNKNILRNGHNNTELNDVSSYQSDPKISNYQDFNYFRDNKSPYDDFNNNKQNFYNYASTYPTTETENSMKASPINAQSLSKFPKLLDFINTKPYDTLESENKYSVVTEKSVDTFKSMPNSVNDDTLRYFEDHNNKLINNDKDLMSQKENLYSYQGYANKYSNGKNNLKSKKLNNDYRDEVKLKPWAPENISNDRKRVKNPLKAYEYATNFSRTGFQFDVNEPNKQYHSNIDEVIPSSSNVDFSNYHLPENHYSNIKPKPIPNKIYNTDSGEETKYNIYGSNYSPTVDYLNKFKNSYSTVPTTTTNWGNIFKYTDYSSYKTHIPKPQYTDEENFDTVHITNRPYSFRYGKDSDSVANDWPEYNKRPGKYNRHKNEWNKENFNNRFKSEEDLLGLRNHDTSHPSYLPTFQYSGNEDPEDSFKKAVEKWRENYIKSKYRDTPSYDYEASEAQNVHALNPYHIEVPRPVIVPVPQPYPVRVPVPKPIAVPVMREITVPIEKPVPYPVYKKVPYPIEKLVPVPVEKQVPVPVAKPYPVAVPQVRPVFHHSRPHREEYDLDHDIDDDDDYQPRPESTKVMYSSKRPKSARNRFRRPSRMSHQERSKGRPQRRPSSRERESRRPVRLSEYQRHKYHDADFDEDKESSEYRSHCKRIGNC